VGRYVTLAAGSGWLQKWTTAFTAPQSAAALDAEAEADAKVDELLVGFNKSAWPLTVPPLVAIAAEKYAAARFLRRDFARSDTATAPDGKSLPAILEAEAIESLNLIAQQGYVVLPDGTTQKDEDGVGSMFAEIRR